MKEISKEVEGFEFDEAKTKVAETDSETYAAETPSDQDASTKVDITGVKGFMTIKEASEYMEMELKDFYTLFQIPESVPNQTKMKEIESISPGYDFESIKETLR